MDASTICWQFIWNVTNVKIVCNPPNYLMSPIRHHFQQTHGELDTLNYANTRQMVMEYIQVFGIVHLVAPKVLT